MKILYCFFISFFLLSTIHAQKNEIIHAYDSSWEPIKEIEKASYFMSTIKENDSLYTCRYYHILGPMIYLESYKDEALEIPNGFFAWYDTTGRIDSLGYVHNGKKNGKWTYGFNDSGKAKIESWYTEGKFQKSFNHSTNTIVYANGEIADLTKEIIDTTDTHPPTFKGGISNWIKYIEQNLVPPKRLYNISIDNTKYTVVVDFMVNVLGEVEDIFLFRSCEWSADMEAIRVLKKSPKWIPATNKGIPEPKRHRQSLSFNMRLR